MNDMVDTRLILDDPYGSFVKELDKDLSEKAELQVVAGFVSRNRISILTQYLKSRRVRLKNLVFGGGNLGAVNALAELKREMNLDKSVIRFHPGRMSAPSSGALFRPMLHSKIYFVQSPTDAPLP